MYGWPNEPGYYCQGPPQKSNLLFTMISSSDMLENCVELASLEIF